MDMKTNSAQRQTIWSAMLVTGLMLGSSAVPAAEDPSACASALDQPREPGRALKASFGVLSWNIQKASNDGWSDDLGDLAATRLELERRRGLDRDRAPGVTPSGISSRWRGSPAGSRRC